MTELILETKKLEWGSKNICKFCGYYLTTKKYMIIKRKQINKLELLAQGFCSNDCKIFYEYPEEYKKVQMLVSDEKMISNGNGKATHMLRMFGD